MFLHNIKNKNAIKYHFLLNGKPYEENVRLCRFFVKRNAENLTRKKKAMAPCHSLNNILGI